MSTVAARIYAELRGDKAIWAIIALLAIFSLLAVYSSTGTLAYKYRAGNTEYYLMKQVLIIGGGSGVAPFLLLGKKLKELGTKMTFLIGGRSAKDILLTDRLAAYGDVLITTEDGSKGETGMVTDHSIIGGRLNDFDKIYTCGPDAMMKAIAKLARDNKIDCEASLENMMACGFGACLCCVVDTTQGNLCVCTEGPVFNILDLAW